jgi:ribonuclease VapC
VILDTSAVLAILFHEPDAERFARAIATASSRRMSAATLLETTIVLESRSGAAAGYELDSFLQEAEIELEPVTPDQAQAARRAWRRFGKGNHPAGLNFGDCFAYALAEATREPLLFKGGDFDLTDVEVA